MLRFRITTWQKRLRRMRKRSDIGTRHAHSSIHFLLFRSCLINAYIHTCKPSLCNVDNAAAARSHCLPQRRGILLLLVAQPKHTRSGRREAERGKNNDFFNVCMHDQMNVCMCRVLKAPTRTGRKSTTSAVTSMCSPIRATPRRSERSSWNLRMKTTMYVCVLVATFSCEVFAMFTFICSYL
jgi:hypothetical protein